MKRKILILFIFICISAGRVISQNSGVGLGVIVGEPTGISAKVWISNNSAFDAGVA